MTRQDYIMIAEAIAECYNMKYDLNGTAEEHFKEFYFGGT